MEKIKSIIKKFCTKEVISYIIFGILTTLVNITISFVLTTACKIEGNLYAQFYLHILPTENGYLHHMLTLLKKKLLNLDDLY